MKRLIVLATIVLTSFLAALALFQTSPVGASAPCTGNLIVPVTDIDAKVAPVYDTSGALVSDPTGTIWCKNYESIMIVPVTGADRKVAPVYDSTGALISDPTGTIWSSTNP